MPILFKDAHVYRLAGKTTALDEAKLAEHLFAPCLAQQHVSLGWVPPMIEDGPLVHGNGGNWLICLKKQERLLPGPVVRKALADKIKQIQQAEDRRVGSKERQTLKDEVIFSLLPKAFTRDSLHYAYINPQLGLMVVDSTSEGGADTLTSFLRESLGSLPLVLLQNSCLPAPKITEWVRSPEAVPRGWELLPDLALTQSSNHDVQVRLKNLELDGDAVALHLEQDGEITQIAFEWQDRLTATLTDKAQFKRIKFSDLVTEQINGDDMVAQRDTSFLLMATELNRLVLECEKLFNPVS